jgi:hypothetical protein
MGPSAYGNEGDAASAQADETARLAVARERLKLAQDYDRSNEEAMHEDGLFLVGGRNQWDPLALRERDTFGRPVFTGNLFPPLLAQITGEIRRNKPGITCKPGDSDATKEAAEVFEGLIRSIERLSQAHRVYARVGKAAASVGKGHMRLVPVYADDESFDVELRIRAIKNVYSVKWDPSSSQDDKSDANWCYVTSEVDKKSFDEAYPQAGEAAWAKAQANQRQIDGWRSGNRVTVCEEWLVKKEPYQRYRVAHTRPTYFGPQVIEPTGEEAEIDGDIGARTVDGIEEERFIEAIQAQGFDVVQSRTAYKKTVCMYLWGGDKQLAGPIEWKGARIPIFTCVGEEIDLGDQTIEHGIIRHAKDDQRSYNYARSAQLELVSQAPKSPILVADDQIEGHEDVWALAQKRPVPYLPYNKVDGLGAPQERSGPQANSGPSELADRSLVGVKDTTGIQDAAIGKRTNETSGVAIGAREAQVDTGTFVYLDNLNSTIEAMGNELVAAIPHYYSTRKQILILGQDDAPAIIELANIDLNLGKYHVICQRGPSYQTKREKASEHVVNVMKIAPPPAVGVLFDILVDLADLPITDDQRAQVRASLEMAGMIPPAPGAMPPGMPPGMPGMPGMPPGMQPGMPPGAPPMPPGAPPGMPPQGNIIPMQPRGRGPAQMSPPDPLAGLSASPPRAPALRQRVGPPQGVSPGM